MRGPASSAPRRVGFGLAFSGPACQQGPSSSDDLAALAMGEAAVASSRRPGVYQGGQGWSLHGSGSYPANLEIIRPTLDRGPSPEGDEGDTSRGLALGATSQDGRLGGGTRETAQGVFEQHSADNQETIGRVLVKGARRLLRGRLPAGPQLAAIVQSETGGAVVAAVSRA
jgi:hypothetical protein